MATTRLNQYIRDAIEESLINATTIPADREKILKDTGAIVREAVRKCLPKGFEAAVANLPPEWFPADEGFQVGRGDVSPRYILASKKDQENNSYNLRYLKFDVLRHPQNFYISSAHISDLPDEKDPKKPNWSTLLDKQIKAAHKLRDKEDTLRREIRAVLYACNTAEKLIEEVPEWEKHILPHLPSRPMPLVVQPGKAQSLLAKAGFDQTEKSEKEAA